MIYIQNGASVYQPVVKDGITWTTARAKEPGKLMFSVVKDDTMNIQEGNPVAFKHGGDVFYGFIFKKKRDKSNLISVTAYDQLRYFKNKDTYVYSNKKTSELLPMLANDFNLNVGSVDDTGYPLSRVEDNKTLFDMMNNSLNETLQNTKRLYVLYDDFGKLTLKNIENMKLDLLIDEETGQNFSYVSSIDSGTYNKIKITYDNKETGKREVYIAQDTANMNEWGTLQYYDKTDNPAGAIDKVNALLSLYNKKTRNLTVKDAFGDIRARAGASVAVQMTLDDITIQNYMLIEKAKHVFNQDLHTMDLTLRGGDFIA